MAANDRAITVDFSTAEVASPIPRRAFDKKRGVYNVLDYGLSSDGTAVNDAALAALLTSLAGLSGRPTLLFPTGVGYAFNSTVRIPGNVDVQMDAPLIYTGSGAALVISDSIANGGARPRNGVYRLRVTRATQADWSTEADVGITLYNLYWCDVHIPQVSGFTVGIKAIGDGHGVSYNNVRLGVIQDCKIGLDLDNANSGWCNENLWIGGSWTIATAILPTVDRTAIRFSSQYGYYNNANLFLKPSFEVKGLGIDALGLCVDAAYGSYNTIQGARHESPDALSMIQRNNSVGNIFEAQFNLTGNVPRGEDQGTFAGQIFRVGTNRVQDEAKRLIRKVDAMHTQACYYDGSSAVQVPGAGILTSSAAAVVRGSTTLAIGSGYLEVGGGRSVGFYMSTRLMKRFTLAADADNGFGGRYLVAAYDSAGAPVSTVGAVRSTSGNPSYATTFGGAWRTGTDGASSKHFTVSDAVDYVFVGIGGGSAVARVRSFSAYALDGEFMPATWLPWVEDGVNAGTTFPTAGTWERGRRINNDAPTAGGASGWVCITAGSPGTWKTLGTISA